MFENLKINIQKRNRKTLSIYIERDGSLTVYAPEHLSQNEIDAILQQREYQIYKYLAKWEMLNTSKISREPVNGQSFLYLGRNYYLQYSSDVKALTLKGKYFYVPESKREKLPEAFKEFYREKGKIFITPRMFQLAEKMGVHPEEISVLELKNRWASCSLKKPRVNFHWKVMMAPVTVLDYLIVHELAHFKFKKHDSAFWNEVDKVLPNYQKQVDWLKRYGASLTV
ncbi:MAG: SprT family zinc-dependent metalloprotease [Dehalococcoidales bacterium]|nr:SprT family zinc-dependent metalloprotease [Dehalococcoidales bacterium]